MKSNLEHKYEAYLKNNKTVKLYEHRKQYIIYVDGFTGKEHKYYTSFRIEFVDGHIEHVEVKPLEKQFYCDKYLYAENVLPGWRWITKEELAICSELI
jgi:hypothetical protein